LKRCKKESDEVGVNVEAASPRGGKKRKKVGGARSARFQGGGATKRKGTLGLRKCGKGSGKQRARKFKKMVGSVVEGIIFHRDRQSGAACGRQDKPTSQGSWDGNKTGGQCTRFRGKSGRESV